MSKLPSNYQRLRAGYKRDLLWQQVVASRYLQLPASWPGEAESSRALRNSVRNAVSFTLVADEFPYARTKVLHSYGVVGRVRLVVDPDLPPKYSGLFRAPGAVGLVRYSLASEYRRCAEPNYTHPFNPGVAIKLFVDGRPSVNLFANLSLYGQSNDVNFFRYTLASRVAPPNQVLPRYKRYLRFVRHLDRTLWELGWATKQEPLSMAPTDAASIRPDGRLVPLEKRTAPETLYLEPNSTLCSLQEALSPDADFRDRLRTIKGSEYNPVKLADIVGESADKSNKEKFGTLELVSEFIASEYGDSRLFFQHPLRRSK